MELQDLSPKLLAPSSELLSVTDPRGRYAMAIPEGAHTIEVTAPGHTTVWRQIVVPAGTGVVPIDIRLSTHGATGTIVSSDLTLNHGGETRVTTPVTLTVPSGSLTAGNVVTLTSVGTQSLAGLLPLGWSPLASAEVVLDATSMPSSASLSFEVSGAAITDASQTLTAVTYLPERDEWFVLVPSVTVDGNTATVPLAGTPSSKLQAPSSFPYALVYPDEGPGLTTPPTPDGGTALVGITDPCATPGACGELTKDTFTLDPAVVLPDQRTTATLRVTSSSQPPAPSSFPSGTAVQAYIDEELQLADGSTITDPPFATDLLLYRGLDGGAGEARFHLAPSKRAAEVILQVGYEHIRVHPYPGRLDRGTLIGNEGGRVPGDGTVSIDIPEGAAPEPVHAEVARLSESALSGYTLEGYTVLGGLDFTLSRAGATTPQDLDGDGQPDPIADVQLFKPASMTYVVDGAELPAPDSQVILAEVLGDTGYPGQLIRLTALMSDTASSAKTAPQSGRSFQLRSGTGTTGSTSSQAARAKTFQLRSGIGTTTSTSAEVENFGHLTAETAVRYTTQLPTTALPVDGLTREGTYLVLAANNPVAYATGLVRSGSPTGPIATGAKVSTSPEPQAPSLGVSDLVRTTGIYAIPVPAAGFALTPSRLTLGTGTPYENPAAVETGSVQNIQLVLTPEPLRVETTTPANGAVEVSLGTIIQVQFSRAIDAASVTPDSIRVTNTLTGSVLSGTTTVAGQFLGWNAASGVTLVPNTRYSVTVTSRVRATSGTPLGATHTFSFATITELVSTEINRDRIRITIPDGTGVSTVSGTAGAIPAGWQAIPVRRLRDFRERYQATAATDGSFTMTIGTTAGDEVAITDTIDLQLVNTSGILTAVIRLTPFVTADGLGFIAPPDRETRFTSADNITVTVPAGAFDEPTLVTVFSEQQSAFGDVPNFDTELLFSAGLRLDFDGIAKERLQVEIPAAGTLDPNTDYLLGYQWTSRRGPRIMIADTLTVQNGKLTTAETTGSASKTFRTANAVLAGPEAKKALLGVTRPGTYAAIAFVSPVTWVAVEGLATSMELLLDALSSIGIPSFYLAESQGRAILPVPIGAQFTITGVDEDGVDAFTKVYEPLIPTDPGVITAIANPGPDLFGPFPIFATPFVVEMTELTNGTTEIGSLRVKLESEVLTITQLPNHPLPEGTTVQALNSTRGRLSAPVTVGGGGAFSLTLTQSKRGDRIVVFVSQGDVDPETSLSVVFSEPLKQPEIPAEADEATAASIVNAHFAALLKFSYESPGLGSVDLSPQVQYRHDSSYRRIELIPPSSLVRGGRYRLTIKGTLTDKAGNVLLSVKNGETQPPTLIGNSAGKDVTFELKVREPKGDAGTFDIVSSDAYAGGSIRDLAQGNNLLFVSALDGGLLAYDIYEPLELDASNGGAQPQPISVVPAVWKDASGTQITMGFDQHWAVATDTHGRVYSTGFFPTFGVIRSYREEDFRKAATENMCAEQAGAPGKTLCKYHGSAIVSWRPGYSSGLPLSSSDIISDRAEAYPRKLQVITHDVPVYEGPREAFKLNWSTSVVQPFSNGLERLSASVELDRANPYLIQRITIENVTTKHRWSADARPGEPAVFDEILAMPGDTLRVVRNQKTFGVISLFGFGVGIYDLNAIESNDAPNPPDGYQPPREQVLLTKGDSTATCPPRTLPTSSIQSLTFTPETMMAQTGDRRLTAYALESHRGLLDLSVTLPSEETAEKLCVERSTTGLMLYEPFSQDTHPRLGYIKTIFSTRYGRTARPRFNSIAPYRWRLSADGNASGVRGSNRNTGIERDYALIAGGDFGLLVVETDARPIPADIGSYAYLTDRHLADVIWIPAGAVAVRTFPGTDYAVVVDGRGRLLLVDLSRIDERWNEDGSWHDVHLFFRTATKSLEAPGIDGEVGVDDPRVVWKSEPGFVEGAIAPLLDTASGIAFSGKAMAKTMKMSALIDAKMQIVVDAYQNGSLRPTDGLVPLGVAQPVSGAALTPKGALSAFRVSLRAHGGLAESLPGGKLRIAVESERVPGGLVEQTPGFWPRAHLRLTAGDGPEHASRRQEVWLTPEMLQGASAAETAEIQKILRKQKSPVEFLSPWIVAVADPRASRRYEPSGAPTGTCANCTRPEALQDKSESDGVYELWSSRLVSVRPECPSGTCSNPFGGTPYDYLGTGGRLSARVSSVPAETLRLPGTEVPAQNPPVASGMLQDTIYPHSGEVETSSIDLVTEGRAGMDVVVDRSYRSRSIGWSYFGLGWESSLFRRVRGLPNGNAEYRDGSGEVWLFRRQSDGTYQSPPGLFVRLTRKQGGWTITDQRYRIERYDDYGRLTAESDEFHNPNDADSGNVIHYFYDRSGRLHQIVDPVQRITTVRYWTYADTDDGAYPGLVKEIEDWRGRTVRYEYDGQMRLVRVKLPEIPAESGVPAEFAHVGAGRPTIQYSYASVETPPSGDAPDIKWTNYIEFAGNLTEIKEPAEVAKGAAGFPRVKYSYETTDVSKRDRVLEQAWPCASANPGCQARTARVEYHPNDVVHVFDALNQKRAYKMTLGADARKHFATASIDSVPFVEVPETLPNRASLDTPMTIQNLVTYFNEYNEHGQPGEIVLPNGLTKKFTFGATPGFPGSILKLVEDSVDGIITRFLYGDDPNALDTVMSIAVGSASVPEVERDRQTPHRNQLEVFTGDDEMEVWQSLEKDGQIRSMRMYKPGLSTPSRRTDFEYYEASDEETVRRGRLKEVDAGEGRAMQSITYQLTAAGGEIVVAKDNKTGVVTETETDAAGQTIRQVVKDAGGAEVSREIRGYDASGRLVYVKRRQTDVGSVEETMTYDVMGRVVSRSMTNASVGGAPQIVTQNSSYVMSDTGLVVTEQGPFMGSTASGPETITTHDKLGRPAETRTTGADGATLLQRTAYDIGGNPAYVTDAAQSAILYKYDLKGRLTESVRSDGIATKTTWTPWNQREDEAILEGMSDDPEDLQLSIGRTKYHYTQEGKLRLTNVQIDASGQSLASWNVNRGGVLEITKLGMAPSVDEEPQAVAGNPVRTERVEYDFAGRETKRQSGVTGVDGVIMPPQNTYAQSEVTSYRGAFPQTTIVAEPRAGASFRVTREYDGLGRVIREQRADEQPSLMTYDEAGNLVRAQAPGVKASTATYDARGLAVSETRPGGASINRTYDALGNLTKLRDEAGRETLYSYDGLGRPTRVTYPDATFERTIYAPNSGEVTATRDRAGQWLVYHYDERGWLSEVRDGGKAAGPETDIEPDINGAAILRYTHDAGGRVTKVSNKDAAIESGDHDFLGRPRISRMIRYKDGTGLGEAPEELDRHTMEHRWNVFSEITEWRMPAAGVPADVWSVPVPGNAGPWLGWMEQQYDPAGNLVRQSSMETGTPVLSEAIGRGFGRISRRSLPVSGGNLTSWLGYADGSVADPVDGIPGPSLLPPFNGMLGSFEVSTPAGLVGGTEAKRDPALRLLTGDASALGSRRSVWGYDDVGRLKSDTILAMTGGASALPTNLNDYIDADFRSEREMAPRLGTEQVALLKSKGIDDLVPESWSAVSGLAHAVEERTIDEAARDYIVSGARRTSDAVWTMEYDAFGRMIAQQREGSDPRRIEYLYDPNDRIIARVAKTRQSGGEWVTETRSDVNDGLPADTTWVWDPMTDRLVAVYQAGVSATDPNAGLVRQVLHGDQGYDDPIEVRVVSAGDVARYFPVADPLSGGSITAVLDEGGTLVERILYADSYGDAPRYLQGPVVDQISVEAEKDGAGNVRRVIIRSHLSESIDEATLGSGVSLDVVKSDGKSVAATAAVVPALVENHTVEWRLEATEWAAITAAQGAASLRVRVMSGLRAETWGNASVMAPPRWAEILYGVRTSADAPVVWLEQLSEMNAFLGTIPANGTEEKRLYELSDLYLAANVQSKTKLLTGFHAASFVEPASGLAYFRDRWYDPATGQYASPDPEGYDSSSNMYLAFGGDPVNLRDPDGHEPVTATAVIAYLGWVTVNTGVDVLIDWGAHELLGPEDEAFDWHESLTYNFGVNLVSGGLGGKLAKIDRIRRIARNPGARKLLAETLEVAFDVGATGTAGYVASDQSASEAFGTALVGRILGGKAASEAGFMVNRLGRSQAKGFVGEQLAALERRLHGERVLSSQITLSAGGARARFDLITQHRRTGVIRVVEAKLGRTAELERGQPVVAAVIQLTGQATAKGPKGVRLFRSLGFTGGSVRKGVPVADLEFLEQRFPLIERIIDLSF